MNSDRLSLSETLRIRRKLTDIGIPLRRVVVNKLGPGEPVKDLTEEFGKGLIVRLLLGPSPLLGLPALRKYLEGSSEAFTDLLGLERSPV
jgi:hypothetical protein